MEALERDHTSLLTVLIQLGRISSQGGRAEAPPSATGLPQPQTSFVAGFAHKASLGTASTTLSVPDALLPFECGLPTLPMLRLRPPGVGTACSTTGARPSGAAWLAGASRHNPYPDRLQFTPLTLGPALLPGSQDASQQAVGILQGQLVQRARRASAQLGSRRHSSRAVRLPKGPHPTGNFAEGSISCSQSHQQLLKGVPGGDGRSASPPPTWRFGSTPSNAPTQPQIAAGANMGMDSLDHNTYVAALEVLAHCAQAIVCVPRPLFAYSPAEKCFVAKALPIALASLTRVAQACARAAGHTSRLSSVLRGAESLARSDLGQWWAPVCAAAQSAAVTILRREATVLSAYAVSVHGEVTQHLAALSRGGARGGGWCATTQAQGLLQACRQLRQLLRLAQLSLSGRRLSLSTGDTPSTHSTPMTQFVDSLPELAVLASRAGLAASGGGWDVDANAGAAEGSLALELLQTVQREALQALHESLVAPLQAGAETNATAACAMLFSVQLGMEGANLGDASGGGSALVRFNIAVQHAVLGQQPESVSLPPSSVPFVAAAAAVSQLRLSALAWSRVPDILTAALPVALQSASETEAQQHLFVPCFSLEQASAIQGAQFRWKQACMDACAAFLLAGFGVEVDVEVQGGSNENAGRSTPGKDGTPSSPAIAQDDSVPAFIGFAEEPDGVEWDPAWDDLESASVAGDFVQAGVEALKAAAHHGEGTHEGSVVSVSVMSTSSARPPPGAAGGGGGSVLSTASFRPGQQGAARRAGTVVSLSITGGSLAGGSKGIAAAMSTITQSMVGSVAGSAASALPGVRGGPSSTMLHSSMRSVLGGRSQLQGTVASGAGSLLGGGYRALLPLGMGGRRRRSRGSRGSTKSRAASMRPTGVETIGLPVLFEADDEMASPATKAGGVGTLLSPPGARAQSHQSPVRFTGFTPQHSTARHGVAELPAQFQPNFQLMSGPFGAGVPMPGAEFDEEGDICSATLHIAQLLSPSYAAQRMLQYVVAAVRGGEASQQRGAVEAVAAAAAADGSLDASASTVRRLLQGEAVDALQDAVVLGTAGNATLPVSFVACAAAVRAHATLPSLAAEWREITTAASEGMLGALQAYRDSVSAHRSALAEARADSDLLDAQRHAKRRVELQRLKQQADDARARHAQDVQQEHKIDADAAAAALEPGMAPLSPLRTKPASERVGLLQEARDMLLQKYGADIAALERAENASSVGPQSAIQVALQALNDLRGVYSGQQLKQLVASANASSLEHILSGVDTDLAGAASTVSVALARSLATSEPAENTSDETAQLQSALGGTVGALLRLLPELSEPIAAEAHSAVGSSVPVAPPSTPPSVAGGLLEDMGLQVLSVPSAEMLHDEVAAVQRQAVLQELARSAIELSSVARADEAPDAAVELASPEGKHGAGRPSNVGVSFGDDLGRSIRVTQPVGGAGGGAAMASILEAAPLTASEGNTRAVAGIVPEHAGGGVGTDVHAALYGGWGAHTPGQRSSVRQPREMDAGGGASSAQHLLYPSSPPGTDMSPQHVQGRTAVRIMDGLAGGGGVSLAAKLLYPVADQEPMQAFRSGVRLASHTGAGGGGVSTVQTLLYGADFGRPELKSLPFAWPDEAIAAAASLHNSSVDDETAMRLRWHERVVQSLSSQHFVFTVQASSCPWMEGQERPRFLRHTVGDGSTALLLSRSRTPHAPPRNDSEAPALLWDMGVARPLAQLPAFVDSMAGFVALHACDLTHALALQWAASCHLDSAGTAVLWQGVLQKHVAGAKLDPFQAVLELNSALETDLNTESHAVEVAQARGGGGACTLPGAPLLKLALRFDTDSDFDEAANDKCPLVAFDGVFPRVALQLHKGSAGEAQVSALGAAQQLLAMILTDDILGGMQLLHMWVVRLSVAQDFCTAAWRALQHDRRSSQVDSTAASKVARMLYDVRITVSGVQHWLQTVIGEEGFSAWMLCVTAPVDHDGGVTSLHGLRQALHSTVRTTAVSCLLVPSNWTMAADDGAVPVSAPAQLLEALLHKAIALCQAARTGRVERVVDAHAAFGRHHKQLLMALLGAAGRHSATGDAAAALEGGLAAVGAGHVLGLLQALDWNGCFARRYGLAV